MSKKSAKAQTPTQKPKSKEELLKEAQQIFEAKRQRQLVIERIWPCLLKNSTSIKDANVFLQVCKMAIQKAFNNQMLVQTVEQIGVLNNIDPKADRSEMYKEFIDIFKNEKVNVTIQLIEGLGQATDGFISKELMGRKLETLKTDFLPFNEDLKPDGTVQTGAKKSA